MKNSSIEIIIHKRKIICEQKIIEYTMTQNVTHWRSQNNVSIYMVWTGLQVTQFEY